MAADYGLRLLFTSLGGLPLSVAYATDGQFADGEPDAMLVAEVHGIAENAVRLSIAKPDYSEGEANASTVNAMRMPSA